MFQGATLRTVRVSPTAVSCSN